MHPNLSFEQAPPVSVPLRFFLTAPLFGIAAGLLLFVQGGEMLTSRWTLSALAGTHLLAAGFMLQAMCGALLQFVPVAAGGNIWRPRLVVALVHPLLVVAACLLVAAFLGWQPGLFAAAAHCFTVALGLYTVTVGIAVWRTPAQGAPIMAIRIAVVALLVAAALGVTLATSLSRGWGLPLPLLTDVHAAWGLGGWALILLMGVSYFVVPTFQVTPAYPPWLARAMPPLLLAFLLAWSGQIVDMPDNLRLPLVLGGMAVAGVFAATTLHLQWRRRRKVGDTTLLFFRTSMLCLLAMPLLVLLGMVWPALGNDPRFVVWLGMLALAGVFVSAICGMLYKIVPFMCWMHLQRLCRLGTPLPTMNQISAEPAPRRQYYAHLVALVLLLAAVWLPALARPAGLVLAIDCAWLGINLAAAARAYWRFKSHIRAGT